MHAAIIVSEFLTVLCLGMSFAVIVLWMPGNLQREESVKSHPSVKWLVMGIVTSFLASIADNLWWGIAWGNRYFDTPYWEWWFDCGVYSNIVSRQGLKLFAAWCHVKAAIESRIIEEDCVKYFAAFLFFAATITAILFVI
tara:strand:+ start:84 stop:503 length:420 start_codon:yes stop_codon:yes gene_type:complete